MPATVPMVNFSVLGALPQTYRSAQLRAVRDAALKGAIGPGGTIDYGRVLGGLAQAGDIEGLLQVGRLKSAADARAANNTLRQASLGLQSRSVNLAERKFKEEQLQRKRQLDALRALGSPSPISAPQIGPSSAAPPGSPTGYAPEISPLSPQPIASQGAPGVQVAGAPQSITSPEEAKAAEIDRLQRSLLVPNLPPGAQKYIQERLRMLNPDYNRTPAGAGMIEQAKAEAKASVKAEAQARDAEEKASLSLRRFAIIKPLADRLKTSATFPAQIKVGSFAKAMFGNNAGPVLAVLGLKPDDIGNAQAFNAIANQSIGGLIGTGPNALLPANQFTEKDRELILSTVPQLGDDPRAIALKIEIANRANRLVVERGQEWRRYKKSHRNARYVDFVDDWNGRLAAQDRFGDLAREAEEILGTTKSGGVNAPTSAGRIKIDINGKIIQ